MAPQVRGYQHYLPRSRGSACSTGLYRPLELSAVFIPLCIAFAAELGLADPASAAFMFE